MTGVSEDQEAMGEPSENAEAVSNEQVNTMHNKDIHEVVFVAYPKLLFIWPLILLGFVLWLPGAPQQPASTTVADEQPAEATAGTASAEETAAGEQAADASANQPVSRRLEVLGWIYIWALIVVLLTLGVDVDRNKAVFWIVVVVAIYILGLWLHDAKGFTFFGDIHRWFAGLDVQYDRAFGLTLSILMLIPYVIMLLYARLNDRWRITHNEFEHYSFGKSSDSLGRGAKTIRTHFPDVFELLLGLAGTLVVYNATGTRELRRIPHVMFLPFVRRRLDEILEKTAITAGQMDDEEDDEEM